MQWCGRHVTSATGRAQKLRHDATTLRWHNLRVVTHCAATAMRNRIGQHRFKIKQCTTTQGETDREKQSKANSLQYQIVALRVRQHAAIAPKVDSAALRQTLQATGAPQSEQHIRNAHAQQFCHTSQARNKHTTVQTTSRQTALPKTLAPGRAKGPWAME